MTEFPERMDTADIAEYLRLERPYVTDRIVKQADFPAPIINRGPRLKRWRREDVMRWAAGQSLEPISSEVAP